MFRMSARGTGVIKTIKVMKRKLEDPLKDCSSKKPCDTNESSNPSKEKYSLIACGSFNPITNMHLRMFEVAKDYVQRKLNVEVSIGLISPVSDGYKKKGLEISTHRVKMCSLAIKSNPWLEVSSSESEQKSWTPTLKVLRNVKNELESRNISKLMLLCGSDFFESFNKPGLWQEADIKAIIKDFGLVVVQRPLYNAMSIMAESKLLSELNNNIHIVADPINNDTSSTIIRQAVRNKESIKYLTPDNVINYIIEHNLYATEESEKKNTTEILAPYKSNAT